MEEQIMYIPGTDRRYSLSNMGYVLSHVGSATSILKPSPHSTGYFQVSFPMNGKRRTHLIHRLMGALFLEESPKAQINHKDGDKANNRLDNLEWVTHKENIDRKHSKPLNTLYTSMRGRKGKDHPTSKAINVYLHRELVGSFDTVSEAAAKLNVDQGNISHVLNGRHKTAGGYTFRYQ